MQSKASPPNANQKTSEGSKPTTDLLAAELLKPKPGIAVGFLETLRRGGLWVLSAIVPDQKGAPTRTLRTPDEVQKFIHDHNGLCNFYYAVNPARTTLNKKAARTDIARIEYILADLDPKPEEIPADAKRRYLANLEICGLPRPTAIIDSGNGLNVLWRLEQRIELGEPVWVVNADGEKELIYKTEDQAKIDDVEARIGEVMRRLDCDDQSTRDICRILRLPGTTNYPNAAKRRKGRVPTPATLISFLDLSYPLAAFPLPAQHPKGSSKAGRKTRGKGQNIVVDSLQDVDVDSLPVSDRCKDLIRTGDTEKHGYPSRSEGVWAVLCEMVRSGCSDDQIAAILWREAIGEHVRDQPRPIDNLERQIARARAEATKADPAAEFGVPDQAGFVLNERRKRSSASQRNIRAALSRLHVNVRHDVFQDRLTIEGLAGFGPLLDDRSMNRLWLIIDETYGFRPAREFFWAVIENEARLQAFHPVNEYLDGLKWDGILRIDNWLSTYAGAESTPYIDAVGALLLVAAVRRIRKPGCKFDEMPVLESDQGTNKSTALRILAVNDDWFSDDVPLNADGKRVIEALSGRWIVEAAELNGMRKGEVEHLKAFLSRALDRARMSYDRLTSEVKRQCVIIGTTNSKEYLRDNTGNRRFWPVTIKQFDCDALRHDRDQLWAEAADREARGETIRLDHSLWSAAAEEQAARRISDPWEEIVAQSLAEMDGKLRVDEAWRLVGVAPAQQTPEQNRRLGEAMRKAGWERTQRRWEGKQCYAYVKGEADRWVRVSRDASQTDQAHVHFHGQVAKPIGCAADLFKEECHPTVTVPVTPRGDS